MLGWWHTRGEHPKVNFRAYVEFLTASYIAFVSLVGVLDSSGVSISNHHSTS